MPGKISILMCTYCGEKYIADQLDSFEHQSYKNWELWISDDGSTDRTVEIVESYRKKWKSNSVFINEGPKKGFAANFFSLICNEKISGSYYAFSDQDDIWENNKIAKAVDYLSSLPAEVPALYCSRTLLVDEFNNEIGFSPLFRKKPSFSNALVQNIGGGNTMVINEAARKLIASVGPNTQLITHDWWMYLAVAACDGLVFYDESPSLRYRQHSGNIVGMNSTWGARITRVKKLWHGDFRQWNEKNIDALDVIKEKIAPINKGIFHYFVCARNANIFLRIYYFYKSGIYRQTTLGNLGLWFAALFKKI